MSSDEEYIYSTEEDASSNSSDSDDEKEVINTTTTSSPKSTQPTPTWQLVAEMTGLSAHAAADLLEIANGDVEKACSLHFDESNHFTTQNTFNQTSQDVHNHNNTDDDNAQQSERLVSEMTGLSLLAARALLDSTGGDVETAVMLYFEGKDAIGGGGSTGSLSASNALVGKRQRRRQNAEDRLRSAAGMSYDAFDAYQMPAKKPSRRRARKENAKQKQKQGFANLDSDTDTDTDTDSKPDSETELDSNTLDLRDATVNGETKATTAGDTDLASPPTMNAPKAIVGKDGKTYFTIQYTKKTFHSLAQAENYMKSKKYKELILVGLKKDLQNNHTTNRNMNKDRNVKNENQNQNENENEKNDSKSTTNKEEEEEDEEWITDEEDQEPWEPEYNDSLFNTYSSTSFEANALYMQHEFSFFVPQLSKLTNPKALFSYLQEKICRFHICLYCNRIFDTIHACRQHMVDVSHCKFDLNKDLTAREYYNLSTTLQSRKILASGHLVLQKGTANETKVIGHRDLKRYYKQNVQVEDTRLAILANRQQNILLHGGDGSGGVRTTMQRKIALKKARKKYHSILTKSAFRFKGTSKAIASTYVYKPGTADNKHVRAIVHHAGSHFHRAGTKQFHRGVRVKGIKMRGRHGSKLSSAMVRQRPQRSGNSSSNRGNRRFDHRRG